MSITARDWAWAQPLPPVTKIVLLALAERADDSGICWPTLASLARYCQVSRATVCRHLDALQMLGLIAKQEHARDDGSRDSNRYYLGLSHPETTPSQIEMHPSHPETTPSQIEMHPSHRRDYPVSPMRPLKPSVTVTTSPTVLSEPPETRARGSSTRPKKEQPPEPTTEEVIAGLVAECADLWPESEVRRRVEKALNHKASDRWKNKATGVQNWIRDDALKEREQREHRHREEEEQHGRPQSTAAAGPGPPAPGRKRTTFADWLAGGG